MTAVAERFGFVQRRHATGGVEQVHRVATLQIVARGSVTQTIGDRRYRLTPGLAMFMPAGAAHVERASRDAEDILVTVPERWALPYVVADRTGRAWALNVGRALLTAQPAESFVLDGLAHLQRLHRLARVRPPWLDAAVRLARQNLSLTAIAARLQRHPSHLARAFLRHEGVTAGEYARRTRLELASKRLRMTNTPIAEVALAVGFCDQSHFTNAFHRLFGITPAEFRRITTT